MFQTQIPTNYPRIKAVVWFNWNAHPGRTWTVDSSQASLEAFRENVALPLYATDSFRDLPAAPIQPLTP